MKQKKKSPSSSQGPSRNYFNPYETTSTSKRSHYTRSTYQEYRNSSSGMKSKQQVKKKTAVKPQSKGLSSSNVKKLSSQTKKASKKGQRVTQNKGAVNTKRMMNVEALTPEQRRMQMRKKKTELSRTQRLQMKRRRQLLFAFKIAFAMCATVGIVWGGMEVKDLLIRPTVSTQTVKVGTLDMSTLFDGIVFRNESVVYSEDQGNAKYIVAEGDKVEKDGIVYVLVDEENLASTATAQEDVDLKIYNEAENREATSGNQDQRYNLAQEVKAKFEEFYNNRYDGNTSNIYTLRSQLDSNVSNRTNLYTAEQEKNNQELVQLKQQIEANMENYQKGKVVTQSGIISYRMDGYETEDAAEAISNMTYQKYNQYRKATSVVRLAPSTLNKEDPIYKLVYNNEWYVVTYIDTKEDQWVEGQRYNLYFDEVTSKGIEFKLLSKKEEDNRTQLVFKTTNQIGSFLGIRDVSFSIGDKDLSGLKIPVQAIVELNLIKIPTAYCVTNNNVLGVYRKKGEITEFVPLQVQKVSDDMNYIIQDLTNASTLQLNDVIVESESGKTYQVTESETSSGVYVVNGQVASFKEIEILVQNGEYALVKNNAKSQLKEMDKIISNPKSIKKDQLLDDMKIQNE